jgi:hypothetical protein
MNSKIVMSMSMSMSMSMITPINTTSALTGNLEPFLRAISNPYEH